MWAKLAIIIIIVIILAYGSVQSARLEDDFLTGTWASTESFNQLTKMDNMFVQYGKPSDFWGDRRMYILIHMHDELIYGKTVCASISRYPELRLDSGDHSVSMHISEIEDEEGITDAILTDFIPEKLTVKYNLENNTIVWYDDEDNIYFKGTKVPKYE